LFEGSPNAIIIFDKLGTIVEINHYGANLSGFKKEELIGKNFTNLPIFSPDGLLPLMDGIKRMEKGEVIESHELQLYRKDGAPIWIIGRVSSITVGNKTLIQGVYKDITEKKQVKQKLKTESREAEERYQNLVNSISDVLIELNLNGNLTFISSQIVDITGHDPQELLGLNLFKLIHPQDKVILNALRGPREVLNFEFRIKHKEGYFVPVAIKGNLIMTGANIKIIGVMRDITERKRAETLIQREVSRIKEVEKIKSNLMKRISHEFNTPLNSIITGAMLLLTSHKDKIGEKSLNIIEIIQKGGYRLKELADNMLIALKIESNDIIVNLQNNNIVELLKNCIESIADEAARRNVHLNVELPKMIELEYDKNLLQKAVYNLLTNAVKNTPENGDIFLKIIKQEDFTDIIVEDTGVGITKKERPKLFKKFGKIERIGKGMDIDIEGSGLGLYIANEIVKLHKGEILMNSKGRNEGSKFIIKLFNT